jgi:hypothetical protein
MVDFAGFPWYLEWAGFELIHLGLTRSNDAEPDEKTILAIGVLSGQPRTRESIDSQGEL